MATHTLTLLSGVNAVCVYVVQYHVKGFGHCIGKPYFKKWQLLKWHLSCSKHLHTANIMYSWFQTFAVFWKLYAFFWVIPWCLNFICRRFGTFCLLLYPEVDGKKSVCQCWPSGLFHWGMLVQGSCGHLRINIHESNSILGVMNKMIYCSLKRCLQLVFIWCSVQWWYDSTHCMICWISVEQRKLIC